MKSDEIGFLVSFIDRCTIIQTASSILQNADIDRDNKIEMKKLKEAMERLSGDRIQDDFIDV